MGNEERKRTRVEMQWMQLEQTSYVEGDGHELDS